MSGKLRTLQTLTLDDKIKNDIGKRLNRIEGQVKGIQRMVDANRNSLDILMQLSSAQEALRGLGKLLLRDCLENCANSTASSKEKGQIERLLNEFMDVLYKYGK